MLAGTLAGMRAKSLAGMLAGMKNKGKTSDFSLGIREFALGL